jgi:hypothetical protein
MTTTNSWTAEFSNDVVLRRILDRIGYTWASCKKPEYSEFVGIELEWLKTNRYIMTALKIAGCIDVTLL